MTIEIVQEADRHVAKLSGNVDTASAGVIQRRVGPLCDAEGAKGLIDCREIGYLNSSCFGEFSKLHHSCALHGGALVLCGLDDGAHEIMQLLGLMDVVTVVSTYEEAVAALT